MPHPSQESKDSYRFKANPSIQAKGEQPLAFELVTPTAVPALILVGSQLWHQVEVSLELGHIQVVVESL